MTHPERQGMQFTTLYVGCSDEHLFLDHHPQLAADLATGSKAFGLIDFGGATLYTSRGEGERFSARVSFLAKKARESGNGLEIILTSHVDCAYVRAFRGKNFATHETEIDFHASQQLSVSRAIEGLLGEQDLELRIRAMVIANDGTVMREVITPAPALVR